jgi:hypothetical protein
LLLRLLGKMLECFADIDAALKGLQVHSILQGRFSLWQRERRFILSAVLHAGGA